MNDCPSPKPEASHESFAKNSIPLSGMSGAPSYVPVTTVRPSAVQAAVSTTEFWPWFAPSSVSSGSVPLTSSPPMSIPRPPLEWIELARIPRYSPPFM